MSYVAYETQCGGCKYYDFQGDHSKGYCSWYRSYYYPGDSCSHQEARESSTSTCYLTTIICELLGYPDDCYALATLRNFRDQVMQKEEKYRLLLLEYDVVGPQLASMIRKSSQESGNDFQDCLQQFYQQFIVSTVSLVEQHQVEEAVSQYKKMIQVLKEYYGIAEITEKELSNYQNYDFHQGGHGKIKCKMVKDS